MVDFRDALKELDITRNIIILVMGVLESVIIFQLLYIFLTLINLFPGYTFFPVAGFFLWRTYWRIKRKKLVEVERKYPFLHEKLRTAFDTLDMDNFMVNKLRIAVIQGLRRIKVSSFVDTKRMLMLLIIICLLAPIDLFVTSQNFHIINMEKILGSISFGFNLKSKLLKDQVPGDLLGKDIKVENVNANQEVEDIASLLAKRRIKMERTVLPEELFKKADKSFEELISKKKRTYIRNYFAKIRSLEG